MVGVVRQRWLDAVEVREQLLVALGRRGPEPENLVEPLELRDADRRGDVGEAVVVAEPRVLEPSAPCPHVPGCERLLSRRHCSSVGRDDDAALAGRDLLVRVEGEDGEVAVRAERPALVLRAERFARVLDEDEAVAVGDGQQLVELAGVAEDVDGDDRARAVGDSSLDGSRIEVQRVRVDVGEDGRGALVQMRSWRRPRTRTVR